MMRAQIHEVVRLLQVEGAAMMRVIRFVAAILSATAIVPPVQQGIAAGGLPFTIEARPPIHVRGNATIAPTAYTPAQIRQAYGFATLINNDGTRQIIAVVE
jgi:hypothetical protein